VFYSSSMKNIARMFHGRCYLVAGTRKLAFQFSIDWEIHPSSITWVHVIHASWLAGFFSATTLIARADP